VSNKGKRHARVVDNLTMAREVEGAIKGDLVRDEYDFVDHKADDKVTLKVLFDNHFLPWAKEDKRTWRNDRDLYDCHLKPRLGGKALEEITAFETEKMKLAMKKAKNKQGRPFTPVTIKHVVVLLKRLFNLANRWRIHKGAPRPRRSVFTGFGTRLPPSWFPPVSISAPLGACSPTNRLLPPNDTHTSAMKPCAGPW